MNYRPNPKADRALAQVKRGRLPELPQPPVITSLAQLQAYGGVRRIRAPYAGHR
ncbi:hypothetical protein [Streptomyces sp. NPDC003996]